MGEIVNLKQVRKQRARQDKAKAAAENAVRFGRSKADRQAEAEAAARAERQLDGHKRDPE